jgi:NTP pyrophosphatase (non-canonical NTP hydrolase)
MSHHPVDDTPPSITALTAALRRFAHERDWEQFHSPKNLAMALAAEAGELLEQFQWLTETQSEALPEKTHAAVREEIADVLLYLLRLSDRLGIDPVAAAANKIKVNARKYPAEQVRGRAEKYTEYAALLTPPDSKEH